MREIKFRAWNKEENKMYYNAQDTYDWNVCPEPSFGEVLNNDDYVVMQYIGLKDKNEKEIYEGDILKVTHPTTGTIRIGEVLCGSLGRFQIKGNYIHCAFNHISAYEWEIIGNICENLDLSKTE